MLPIQYHIMQWEQQRPLSPFDSNDMHAVDNFLQRKEQYERMDFDVRCSVAGHILLRALRAWHLRQKIAKLARVLYDRELSKLVQGHLEPDIGAPAMYQCKYTHDFWYNDTWRLDDQDITQWWYTKEHAKTIAVCADLLRATGADVWHPADIKRWYTPAEAQAEREHQQQGRGYQGLFPCRPGKLKKMTALKKFYFETPQAPRAPRAPHEYVHEYVGLDTQGRVVDIPSPYPTRPIPTSIDETWVNVVEKRMVHHSFKLGWFYKYEDWTSQGMGDVYQGDVWTVVGPTKYVDRKLYTTWYTARGKQVVRYGALPRGTHKGTLANREEVNTLFTHIAQR